jgi:tetratricopeptide (TPR) repeat protein
VTASTVIEMRLSPLPRYKESIMAGREDIYQKAMSEGHSAAWDQQWDKAATAYRKALAEFPDQPKALTSLGLALFELQQYDEALAAYLRAAKVSPNDPMPLEKVAQLSERIGNLPQSIQAALQAAELYIKSHEVEKAVENWLRVTQLDPDYLEAHSYLAMVHERLGHAGQAVIEYIAMASLLQRSGKADKAAEMIGRALRISPGSQEARQAQSILKSGQLLPKPMRPKGGTGPLRMAQVRKMDSPSPDESGLDPVADARQKALTRLAEVLFELTDDGDNGASSSKRGLQAIVKGTGPLGHANSRTMIQLHLSQAIDAQTRGNESQAVAELSGALETGFKDPALYFDLGLLSSKTEQLESSLRHLQQAVKHADYALGTRLLMADILEKLGRTSEATVEYLEALKIADSSVVSASQADEIRQLYEPVIESQSSMEDAKTKAQLRQNIKEMLLRSGWRARVRKAREQLPKASEGTPPMPLAEMLVQAHSNQVIEAIGHIHQMARVGQLRSAMDEAFYSLRFAPTYLPLHTLIGDLLIEEGRVQEAITKFSVVAQAYNIRGETAQSTIILRRIIELAPMDLNARTRLVEHLVARGQVDEALGEYLDLADIYYRLAELDMARKTYTSALRHAQQSSNNSEWSVKILMRMADIDMQRLDWKQALRVFEQVRTIRPDNISVRKNLVDLNTRMNQIAQATSELENYINYLETTNHRSDAIPFLEELLQENPKLIIVRHYLAGEYRHAGQVTEAIAQLDAVGDMLLDAGDKAGATQVIESIIAMAPPNVADYKAVLEKLQSGK